MYAPNLSYLLHRQLAGSSDYESTLQRFESLRGYGLLPRGRQNAGRRLEDDQIANAVLGYVPFLPGFAGLASLVMGNLRPVGGTGASFQMAPDLKTAIAALVGGKEAHKHLVNITLSIIRKENDDDYFARILFRNGDTRQIASYVSQNALTLFGQGAEETFDGDRELTPSARQLVLGRVFFRRLQSDVELSRTLDRPFKMDWQGYESEEEKREFHERLGARNGSNFLNLGVDTQVTWPQEPTRVAFDGHHLVLFPKTKTNSYSVSIDLTNERLSEDQAHTLINRFLSLLSWCDNQHAILREGWSGNPVPVPVSKRDLAFVTAHLWVFDRSIPEDNDLLKCLAYYREGLNAREAGITTFEVLSFYKVFEVRHSTRGPAKKWVAKVFNAACRDVIPEILTRFHEDRGDASVEDYVYRNCRVASAHAAKDCPSDPDTSPEIRRLAIAASVLGALARYFIRSEFSISESYFSDGASPR